jgi:hypothetical protein
VLTGGEKPAKIRRLTWRGEALTARGSFDVTLTDELPGARACGLIYCNNFLCVLLPIAQEFVQYNILKCKNKLYQNTSPVDTARHLASDQHSRN